MEKKVINIPGNVSPAPVSAAVRAGDLLFCSGQCGYDFVKQCFYGDDIETQAKGAMDNLQQVLAEAGSTMDDIVKVNIYLSDVNDFPVVNKIYAGYFPNEKPARTCVQIAKIPLGALVEIEAVAIAH